MKTYRSEYKYQVRFGRPEHIWLVEGAKLAVHLHITDYGEGSNYDRYSGGIEIHYRTPPKYMADREPSHHNCWAIGGACWHDGSSLQATERWIPQWEMAPHDHDRMFHLLQDELEYRVTEMEES